MDKLKTFRPKISLQVPTFLISGSKKVKVDILVLLKVMIIGYSENFLNVPIKHTFYFQCTEIFFSQLQIQPTSRATSCYCCMPRVLVIFKELHYLASAFAFAITAITYLLLSAQCTAVDNLALILVFCTYLRIKTRQKIKTREI